MTPAGITHSISNQEANQVFVPAQKYSIFELGSMTKMIFTSIQMERSRLYFYSDTTGSS